MSKNSEGVKKWRKNIKKIILTCLGGCCQICKYDKCENALEMHHIDPSKKDFSFGFILASCRNWFIIYEELKKCILLCANCHREVHQGITNLPEIYKIFDETEADALRPKRSLSRQQVTSFEDLKDIKKAQEKRRKDKSYHNKQIKMYKNDIEKKNKAERVLKIKTADIDYSKFGWSVKASNVVGIKPQPLVRWMKKHMKHFYDEKCFKK